MALVFSENNKMTHDMKFFLSKRRLVSALALFGFILVLAISVAVPRLEHFFLVKTGQDQTATLNLAVKGLRVTLERYKPIPDLIAARPELRLLFAEPENEWALDNASKLLSETALALGASEVFIEDIDGNPIVSVPSRATNLPEKGQTRPQFSHRPYFNQIVAGGLGQFYALGTADGQRGFFYTAPVRVRERIRGLVTIKFDVKRFEAAWNEGAYDIIVRDSNDIIFMSSQPEWRLKSMAKLNPEKTRSIAESNQFPLELVRPLNIHSQPLDGTIDFVQIDEDGTLKDYVATTSLIARAGWRVTILTPTSEPLAYVKLILIGCLLFVALAAAIAFSVWQRRRRVYELIAVQREAQEALERRVDERTLELNLTNKRLKAEIEDRKIAEQRLRKTQKDLIQAGKLAALGQMSAAISHEMNQPLAAIKAYAENSITFLSRNMRDDAVDNVQQISLLADRMSKIARHLRNFARRPQEQNKAVPVLPVIDDSLSIMRPKIAETGAVVEFNRPEREYYVIGGQVRLQQVFVNLISNALDAVSEQKCPQIEIDVMVEGERTIVSVRDNGVGLSEDQNKLLFDPFYTTKDPGKGLGLGLSISYNIVHDFGGQLTAKNHPDGGAHFQVFLVSCAHSDIIVDSAPDDFSLDSRGHEAAQ